MLAATFRRIVLASLLGGIVSGLALTGVQLIKVIPLIHAAEHYEQVAVAHRVAAREHAAHPHDAVWRLDEGLERTAFTALTNVTTGIGFALVLAALFTLRGGVSTREGILWGLAGFATFFVLPAIGMLPELPGSASADLLGRQLWWLMVVVCSAGGLALIALRREGIAAIAGAALLLLPHLVGAPVAPDSDSPVPPALKSEFLSASAAANGVFWILLGLLTAFGHGGPTRIERPDSA